MFLMVLLLMDGDEPPNGRRHPSSKDRPHLRRHDKNRLHWEKLGYLDEEGNLINPLNPKVHRSRAEEDKAILRATRDNLDSRYHELTKKNDGRDVEEELRVGVIHKLREEVAKSTT